jgi:structural maintenance of chromosome 4
MREHSNASQTNKADLDKLAKEIEKLTKSLATAEKEYEATRDSLKGETEVFQVDIEKKQTELAPWQEKKAKIQALIDIAQAEFDLLSQKANSTENGDFSLVFFFFFFFFFFFRNLHS